MMKFFSLFFLVVVLCGVTASAEQESDDDLVFYPAQDVDLFEYTGRWHLDDSSSSARADWPCSGMAFRVQAASEEEDNIVTLRLNLGRVRAHVVVTNDVTSEVVSSAIWEGSAVWDAIQDFDLPLPSSTDADTKTTYTISLTKLTQATPYMNGVGKHLKSVLEFHGVATSVDSELELLVTKSSTPKKRRRIAMIGASDTAGYCVDGTPDVSDSIALPWKYDNCAMTSHAVLARRLGATSSVQAIAGIGLTQNAFAEYPFLLGPETMPDYYGRALQTSREEWKFAEQPRPDVVVVSLGGNDFNHQKHVPSTDEFQTAYHEFLDQIAQPYLANTAESNEEPLTIVSICGQGDPTESARDPNNDRCRPCPSVEQAVETYQPNPHVRVEYIFIPCDGTVVTGVDDIGCDGHKNRLGQERVANYLEPRLRQIMNWNDDDELVDRRPVVFSTDPSTEPVVFVSGNSDRRWKNVVSVALAQTPPAVLLVALGLAALSAAAMVHRMTIWMLRRVVVVPKPTAAQPKQTKKYYKYSTTSLTDDEDLDSV